MTLCRSLIELYTRRWPDGRIICTAGSACLTRDEKVQALRETHMAECLHCGARGYIGLDKSRRIIVREARPDDAK